MSDRWTFSPSPLQSWFAQHRKLVRILGLLGCAALTAYLIVGTVLLGRPLPWYTYGQLIIYLGMTILLGWLIPRDIDGWQAPHQPEDKTESS